MVEWRTCSDGGRAEPGPGVVWTFGARASSRGRRCLPPAPPRHPPHQDAQPDPDDHKGRVRDHRDVGEAVGDAREGPGEDKSQLPRAAAYSMRSASIGSIWDAFRAGSQVANRLTARSSTGAVTKVTGSVADTSE